MLKLRFSEPFQRQYMDGKISVCKYECAVVDNTTKEIKDKFTVTGYAKCADTDTVDRDFGRKLADSRAKRKAYRQAASVLCPECIEQVVDRVNKGLELLDFIETMQYLGKKETSHIHSLCTEAK